MVLSLSLSVYLAILESLRYLLAGVSSIRSIAARIESSSVKPPSGQYVRSGSSEQSYCACAVLGLAVLGLLHADIDWPGPDGIRDTLGTALDVDLDAAPDGAPDAAPDVA